MPYGIANVTGQPDLASVTEIVSTAWAAGVRWFDTAQAYGDSETILGQALRNVGVAGEAQIVTKLAPFADTASVTAILDSLRTSLARLGLQRILGLLLHREEQLNQWNGVIGEAFALAKQDGLIAHAGVSVYSPRRALHALQLDGLTILQLPANVFDRRMIRAGVLTKAAQRGVQVFIRSIYLQGLALLPPGRVAQTAPFAVSAVTQLESFCRAHHLDRQGFAMRYAMALDPQALLVVGAETREQVAENCRIANEMPLQPVLCQEWDQCWPEDVEPLVNPSQWPRIPVEMSAR